MKKKKSNLISIKKLTKRSAIANSSNVVAHTNSYNSIVDKRETQKKVEIYIYIYKLLYYVCRATI